MKKRVLIPFIAAFVLGIFGFVGAAAQGEAPEKIEKSMCLACHGSFDDIAAATAEYKTAEGAAVNPHRYVPHAEKKDVPECVECHTPHPIPLESKEQVVRPKNLDWCYGCHHMRDFQTCKTCH